MIPGLYVYFLYQVREIFLSLFFLIVFNSLLALFFQGPHNADFGMLEVFPEAPYTILISLDFFPVFCSDKVFFASLCSKWMI